MFTIEFAAERLEQDRFKRIEQLAVLSECKVGVLAAQIEQTSVLIPFGRDRQVKLHIRNNTGQELSRIFTGLIHRRNAGCQPANVLRSQAGSLRSNLRRQFWLYLLRAFRHGIDDLGSRGHVRFVHAVNHHLLAKADNVAKEPV